MIKAKKLLSILCSVAMVASVFATTIANAVSGTTENVARGINYRFVSETETTKVFEVYSTGFGALTGWNAAVDIYGETDKIASVTRVKNGVFTGNLQPGEKPGTGYQTYTAVWYGDVALGETDNLLCTYTIELNAPITENLVIKCYEQAELASAAIEEEFGYIPWYGDGDWEANTLTFEPIKSEPSATPVPATPVPATPVPATPVPATPTPDEPTPAPVTATVAPVKPQDGDVFVGKNGISAVAGVVETVLEKAAKDITWKITITPAAGKTCAEPNKTLTKPLVDLPVGTNMKIGLIVEYNTSDIAGVQITGMEY